MKMTKERSYQLASDMNADLTREEREAGYHYCPDWDFMVIGPDDPEASGCLCD